MARCPYAPHRLVVTSSRNCRRCNGDVRLYVALQALPVQLFNDARRMWEEKNTEGAAAVLARAIELRPGFHEAHWLLAAVEALRGRTELARLHLVRANELGAEADLAWLETAPTESQTVEDKSADLPASEDELPAALPT